MSARLLLLLLPLVECEVSTMFQSCGIKFVVDKSTQEEVKMDQATLRRVLEEHLNHVNFVYHDLIMFEGKQVKFEVAEVKFREVEWGGGSREEYKEQVEEEEGEECLVYVLHSLPLSLTPEEDGRMCSKENIGFITFNRETFRDTQEAGTRFALAHQAGLSLGLANTSCPVEEGGLMTPATLWDSQLLDFTTTNLSDCHKMLLKGLPANASAWSCLELTSSSSATSTFSASTFTIFSIVTLFTLSFLQSWLQPTF